MADTSNPILDQMRGMDSTRRFVLIGALVVLAIAIGFVGRWASTPTYVTLFHDMELKEAGQVGEALAKASIPYRLGPGGTDIEVPVADVARARVSLAKSGLPANGRPGLELFDKPSWGMTDFTQRVTYQRSLEGELARTIGQIQGVDRAEVHLLLPEESAIHHQEHEAGASVVLSLKGGTPLSSETVQGITYIVSNSVEGLAADNVAVMDNSGRVLSLPSSGAGGAGLTGRQLEVQHGIESRTVDKIENLVATVVGVGRVRAQVAAQLSFDQVDATTETYNPDGQVLQTEQLSEGGPSEGGSTPQTIVSNQYQNSRRVEKSSSAAGRLGKLTVAVLVDEKSMRAGEKAKELADIEAMVRNAVGIDSTRSDRLSVLAVPFEPVQVGADPKNAKPTIDPVVMVERVSHPIAGVVAIVVMLLIALQLRGLIIPSRRPSLTGLPGVPGHGGASPALAATGEMSELPPPDDTEVVKLKNRLKHETGERPEVTAQVLKAWLAEN